MEIVNFQKWSHLFEPSIPTFHEKEVKEFYHELVFAEYALSLVTRVHNIEISLNERMLRYILKFHTEGIRFMVNQWSFTKFLIYIGKLDDLNISNVNKKALKGEFQLLFELVNKVLLPRT